MASPNDDRQSWAEYFSDAASALGRAETLAVDADRYSGAPLEPAVLAELVLMAEDAIHALQDFVRDAEPDVARGIAPAEMLAQRRAEVEAFRFASAPAG